MLFNSVDTLAYYGLHVNGAMFRAYYDLMIDKKGMLLSDNYPRDIKKHFENIIDMLSSINVNEHQVSVELHVVLALLASNAEERKELERVSSNFEGDPVYEGKLFPEYLHTGRGR